MLTAEEIRLLRKVVEWRRVNGWKRSLVHEQPQYDYNGCPMSPGFERHRWEYEGSSVEAVVEEGVLWGVNYQPDDGDDTLMHLQGGLIRQKGLQFVIDCLTTVVLPRSFSSAYAAGRESVGRLIEEDAKTCFESQLWWSDGDTEEFDHFGTEQGVIASARRDIGAGNGAVTVVRSEARSYEVRTYRVGEKVLARFGDWDEVTDA